MANWTMVASCGAGACPSAKLTGFHGRHSRGGDRHLTCVASLTLEGKGSASWTVESIFHSFDAISVRALKVFWAFFAEHPGARAVGTSRALFHELAILVRTLEAHRTFGASSRAGAGELPIRALGDTGACLVRALVASRAKVAVRLAKQRYEACGAVNVPCFT
jgi:hypothetical protein